MVYYFPHLVAVTKRFQNSGVDRYRHNLLHPEKEANKASCAANILKNIKKYDIIFIESQKEILKMAERSKR